MLLYILLSLISLLVVRYLIQKIFFVRRQGDLNKIPSPKGIAWIGNAHQIDGKRPHKQFYEWAQDFGGVYVFRALGKLHVVVNSVEGLHEILVTRGKDYGGRPYMYRADIGFGGSKSVAFQQPNSTWKLQRKITHSALKQYSDGLKRIECLSLAAIDEFIEVCTDIKGRVFNPRNDIAETLTNIVCDLILGSRVSRDDPMFRKMIRMEHLYCLGLMGAGDGMLLDSLPLLRFLGNKSYKIICEARDLSNEIWRHYLPKLREDLCEGQERGLADHLLIAQTKFKDEQGQPLLSDDHVAFTLTDIVNGGINTTTSSVYAFINICLHHPNVQAKIYNEVVQTLTEQNFQRITLENRPNMPYTRAVLLELLRYTTLGPLGLPHQTVCQTSVLGYTIPKDTYVIPNLWHAHHDPNNWCQPWAFNPERFLDADGKLLPPDDKRRKGFLPFGAGTRVCLGESLAQSRLFLFIVNLIQHFEFVPPECESLTPCDPRTYEFGGLLRPTDFKVRLVSRL